MFLKLGLGRRDERHHLRHLSKTALAVAAGDVCGGNTHPLLLLAYQHCVKDAIMSDWYAWHVR